MDNGRAFLILTEREREVLDLIADGYTTRQIGELLSISFKTAATHRNHIMKKTGIHKAVRLANWARGYEKEKR